MSGAGDSTAYKIQARPRHYLGRQMRRPPDVSAELPCMIQMRADTQQQDIMDFVDKLNLSKLEHVATSLSHCCHLGNNRQVVNYKANLKQQ